MMTQKTCGLNSLEEFGKKMIRRRRLDQDASLNTQLHRCLGYLQLTTYSLAHTIGVGLYVLTGTLVKYHAGAATSIAYLISGLVCMFTAACYAEFSTIVPRAGSAYLYTYLMLGELPAFLIGWTMISDMIVSMAAISKAFSGTINLMTNSQISKWSATYLVTLSDGSGILEKQPDLVSFFFIFTLILLTLTGVKFSLSFNTVIAFVQILFLTIMIISSFVLGSPQNITNDKFAPYGIFGVFDAIGIAIFAFSGFESLANASEEAENPKKDLPRAIFTSLSICLVLYFLVPISLNYLTPKNAIDISAPFPMAFMNVHVEGLMWFTAVATIIATGAAKIVSMHAIPRMFYAMASDGLLFPFMRYVDPCTRVPIISLFIGGSICMLLALFFNLKTLADFTSIGVIFCYFFIGVDLMVFRYIYDKNNSDYLKLIDDVNEDEINTTMTDKVKKKLIRLRPWAYKLSFMKKFPNYGSKSNFHYLLILFIISSLFIGGSLKGLSVLPNVQIFLSVLIVLFGLICLISFILLSIYEPNVYPAGFTVKFMPLCPCVTILSNAVLFFSLSWETWIRFVVWSIFGLIIYFAYGIWHSLADQDGKQDEITLIEKEYSELEIMEDKLVKQEF